MKFLYIFRSLIDAFKAPNWEGANSKPLDHNIWYTRNTRQD